MIRPTSDKLFTVKDEVADRIFCLNNKNFNQLEKTSICLFGWYQLVLLGLFFTWRGVNKGNTWCPGVYPVRVTCKPIGANCNL